MAVVVGGDEADLVAQQHPVAEDVAGHVADADRGELVDGRVHLELAEVALERLPRAARRDPQRLVVIALRAARGERVAQPEAVAHRRRGWRCRERRRALVGRHHQVGVVVVEHAHALGVHDLALDEVVGEVEQAADEGDVAALDLGLQRGRVLGAPAQVEAALGAVGHDDRVLGHLRAHEPEDLGAVVHAVRPAQAAARDLAAAQVDPLDLGRVDVDLEQRRRAAGSPGRRPRTA